MTQLEYDCGCTIYLNRFEGHEFCSQLRVCDMHLKEYNKLRALGK